MTRRIRIDDEALEELVEAARWYEERERGRGALFADAAFGKVEALNSFPDAGVPVQGVSGALLARQVRLLRLPLSGRVRGRGQRDPSRCVRP